MTFEYWGASLVEYDHDYNATATNERTIELSVAEDFLSRVSGPGLEVGNVLAHYGCATPRTIVDLHERGAGVTNVDVREHEGVYDWLVSVSTIEHIGWDDERDPMQAPLALRRMLGMLSPRGRALVTAPTGYHPYLDAVLTYGEGAERLCTFVRTDVGWYQTHAFQIRPYGPHANAVWLGEWRNDGASRARPAV